MKDKEKIPVHVAIIPDANRRWARERGLEPWKGHEEGAKSLEKILEATEKWKIKHISFWGSSLDNLKKRPLSEKRALLDIYKRYFRKLITSKRVHNKGIRVNVIGHWEEQFPSSLKQIIRECIEKTKHYKNYVLNFLLAYSGDDEILSAVKEISDAYKRGGIREVTAEVLKQHLATKDLPPVDFLIRTGGEPHLSAGFMMWDIANAQLYFTKTKWPDFSPAEFDEAIYDYQRRTRRFGS